MEAEEQRDCKERGANPTKGLTRAELSSHTLGALENNLHLTEDSSEFLGLGFAHVS